MYPHVYQAYSPVAHESFTGMVKAAYFMEEGAFTLFKDSGHAVVLAVRTAFLIKVERGARDN